MKLKLKLLHKLFLANLSITLMLFVLLTLASTWSGGFTQSYEFKEPYIQEILNDLRIHYQQYQQWHFSISGANSWRDLIHSRLNQMTPLPEHVLDQSLSLIDLSGQLVAGKAHTTFNHRYAIDIDGKIVGWLVIHNMDASEADIFHRAKFWIAGLGILLSALVSYLLARHITQPIILLRDASEKISSLNFKARTSLDRDDELGDLARSFNDVSRELLNYEVRQKRWLMDISHELRTPLTILIGEMEAITDGVYPCSLEGVNSLKEEVQQIKRLIDDLHELTIMDRVGFRLDCVPVEINEFLQHQFSRYEERLKHKKVQPLLTCAPGPMYLNADVNRLAQVIQNLFENCCRYVNAPGNIKLSITTSDSTCYIAFDDTGPGVSESALPHLFDPLFRSDSSRNRKTGGAGLGLAICKNIVAAHKGSIDALKSELGGLRIIIKLPLDGA